MSERYTPRVTQNNPPAGDRRRADRRQSQNPELVRKGKLRGLEDALRACRAVAASGAMRVGAQECVRRISELIEKEKRPASG
jgi:hypothetical protein